MITFFDDHAANWNDHISSRDRKIATEIISSLPLKEGMKVLDLACGTGIISSLLYQKTKTDVFAIDFSSKMIEQAKKEIKNPKIHFETLDFFDLTEKNFDCVVLFNAYPHFLDRDKLKRKAVDVLKSKGLFIICHNYSKEDINKMHHSIASLSRELLSVEEEAKYFSDCFDVVDALEDESKYILTLKKR